MFSPTVTESTQKDMSLAFSSEFDTMLFGVSVYSCLMRKYVVADDGGVVWKQVELTTALVVFRLRMPP